jgi:hypothetical protein
MSLRKIDEISPKNQLKKKSICRKMGGQFIKNLISCDQRLRTSTAGTVRHIGRPAVTVIHMVVTVVTAVRRSLLMRVAAATAATKVTVGRHDL